MESHEEMLWFMMRSALCREPVAADHVLPPVDYKLLLSLARHNRVEAMCCRAVEQQGSDAAVPRALWLRWLAERQMAEQKATTIATVAHELVDRLRDAGFRTLVLKGPRLAACYPNPMMRQYDDIDLYNYGQEREVADYVEQNMGLAVQRDAHRSTFRYRNIRIELHHTFSHNDRSATNAEYDRMLLSLLPHATFDTLLLLRHAASHFAASHITAKSVCDWNALVASRQSEIDWPRVAAELRRFNMTTFVGAIQQLNVERLGGTTIPELEPFIPAAQITDRVGHALVFGGMGKPSREYRGMERIVWKWKRYRSFRWRRQLVYPDKGITLFSKTLSDHLHARMHHTS